jgi:type VI secretion system secreted protein VgrG
VSSPDRTKHESMPPIDGGHGTIPVLGQPDIVLSAAGDIAQLTPANSVMAIGRHTTITTEQDVNLLSQRHTAWAVQGGIALFTRGESKNPDRPVQDVGLKLHAASGNVSVQAQSDRLTITAAKAIDLQSTSASIEISAPQRIVLNGGGGFIEINGGDITIGTTGVASFKASMKILTGGASASAQGPALAKAGALCKMSASKASSAGDATVPIQ